MFGQLLTTLRHLIADHSRAAIAGIRAIRPFVRADSTPAVHHITNHSRAAIAGTPATRPCVRAALTSHHHTAKANQSRAAIAGTPATRPCVRAVSTLQFHTKHSGAAISGIYAKTGARCLAQVLSVAVRRISAAIAVIRTGGTYTTCAANKVTSIVTTIR